MTIHHQEHQDQYGAYTGETWVTRPLKGNRVKYAPYVVVEVRFSRTAFANAGGYEVWVGVAGSNPTLTQQRITSWEAAPRIGSPYRNTWGAVAAAEKLVTELGKVAEAVEA